MTTKRHVATPRVPPTIAPMLVDAAGGLPERRSNFLSLLGMANVLKYRSVPLGKQGPVVSFRLRWHHRK